MSCIVGIVDSENHKVFMGADSGLYTDLSMSVLKNPKVFKRGRFLIGCTGSYRMTQLLQFSFVPPEIKGKDMLEYMCTDFIEEVRNCFKEGGFIQKYRDGDEKGGVFLVGYEDRLFKIDEDFQVAEAQRGFDAIGAGANFTKGAMSVMINAYLFDKQTKTPSLRGFSDNDDNTNEPLQMKFKLEMNIRGLVRASLMAAKTNSQFVHEPFVILET